MHCVIATLLNRLHVRALQDLYVDYESGGELMNFLHVFLYSQGLECMVLSMVSLGLTLCNLTLQRSRYCCHVTGW
jgi:hypothetical protein